MSKYTTDVRFICETLAGFDTSQGYGKVTEIISNSWDKIFDFDFPIFDEEYRSVLCSKILMHYYTREIGFETVGLWKLKLMTKMNEVMPYFNELYNSTRFEFNPLEDADYTKEHEGTNDGESSNTETSTGSATTEKNSEISDENSYSSSGTNWNVFSDTPQGALTNVANETYLTDARKITDSKSGTGSATRNIEESGENSTTNNRSNSGEYSNTDEYIDHIKGKFPGTSYSKLLKEYRETIINVDFQVIESLKDLFMKVW